MKYLIFRDDGLGDLIVSTPLIKLIKEKDKNAYIVLLCGDRNFEYAQLYKDEGLINETVRFPSKQSLINFYKNLYYLRSLHVDYTYVLSPKNINYYYAKLSNAKYNFGIVMLNTGKNGRNRYRPAKFIIKYLLNKHVLIDCTENFINSLDTHWSDYYIDLYAKSMSLIFNERPEVVSIENKKYIKLHLNKENNNLTKIFLENKITNKYLTIVHIDEKWDRSNWSNKEIHNFIYELKINMQSGVVILTQGLYETEFNKSIFNEFKFNKINGSFFDCEIFMSNNIDQLFLFKPLNMKLLTTLLSKSDLIIEQHGGLAHIGTMYNKKIVDITYKGHKNFLKKWHPKSDNYLQIEINDFKTTLYSIIDFIKK